MTEDVFDKVDTLHVMRALSEIDKTGQITRWQSPAYDLLFGNKLYSPRQVVALAIKRATGELPDIDEIAEGPKTPAFELIEKMPFQLLPKSQHPLTPEAFLRGLIDYIEGLFFGFRILEWEYRGGTGTIYNRGTGRITPSGFQFDSPNFPFVLTIDGTDIVLLSGNLEAETARLQLGLAGSYKYDSEKTAFVDRTYFPPYYRAAKKINTVKMARAEGMKNDVITAFKENDPPWAAILRDILTWAVVREKVHAALLKDEKIELLRDSHHPMFWLLKIMGENWKVDELKEGEEGYFHATFREPPNSFFPRPDGYLFRFLRPGDKGIAYDYTGKKAVVFQFTVTRPLPEKFDSANNAVTFRIDRKLVPEGKVDKWWASMPFLKELDSDSKKKLYSLTPGEYELLSESPGRAGAVAVGRDAAGTGTVAIKGTTAADESSIVTPFPGRLILPRYSPDSASRELEDQLNFESDVHALASVMVYKEVEPPLAIGLFGNWGTGKSFFMHKLQERIEDLTRWDGELFCRRVLQINFNSWHYSDANLWASLITKIFEDLGNYGKSVADKATVAQLFRNLNSTQELLAEATDEKKAVERRIDDLEKEKIITLRAINNGAARLKGLSLKSILQRVMHDEYVKKDIDQLEEEYSFLQWKEYDDIKENMEIMDTSGKRLWTSLRIIFSFRKGKRWLVLLAAIAAGALAWFLMTKVELVRQWSPNLRGFITLISGSLTSFVVFIQPAMNGLKKTYERLVSLRGTMEQLRKDAEEKAAPEKEELELRLGKEKDKEKELQKNIDLLTIKKESLESEISDITSGKKIMKFIEGRATDTRYVNSLGLISWIRKDFEQLDFLLKEQHDARKLALSGKEKVEDLFRLDRIILYIDDLDRCNATIVANVLDAIHLLLALPLFVVVVGVDPRWMHSALKERHGLPEDSPVEASAATSYDYIEKIFQVPFALQTMETTGKNRLLEAQFRDVVSAEPEPEPSRRDDSGLAVIGDDFGGDIFTTDDEMVHPIPTGQDFSRGGRMTASDDPRVLMINALLKGVDTPREKFDVQPERLRILPEEIAFMQQISSFIGHSPRTVKRYANIYRIIRSHASFLTSRGAEMDDYAAAMLLLAIITGMPASVKSFFDYLADSEDAELFIDNVQAYIQAFPSDEHISRMQKTMIDDPAIRERIAGIKAAVFKRNLRLISRFSFRMG